MNDVIPYLEAQIAGCDHMDEASFHYEEGVVMTGNQARAFIDAWRCNQESLKLLEELADLQNGPPLERYAEDWHACMEKVYEHLSKNKL